MKQCDSVVVSSNVLRESVREIAFSSPVEVIGNGVDTERFRPPTDDDERTSLRKQLKIPADAPLFLYIGIIQPRKGIDLLLKSWKHLARSMPDAHFVLAGSRDDLHYEQFDRFRRKLETLLQESGATDRVHFVGSVDNPEDYYRTADVFLFASALEGMANVLLEAMASELPVVTTPFVGLPAEIGTPGQNYLLAERKPEVIAAAGQQAFQDKTQSNAIGRRAREWAVENLSIEHTMDQYTELYRRIVERRRSTNKPKSREAELVSSSAS